MRSGRRQRGVVMVIALAILVGLVALVASVVASQQIAIRAEENRINARQARVAADAGVQRAMASLVDTIQEQAQAGAATTTTAGTTVAGQAQTQTDEWYTLGDKGAERFGVGNATFRMEIVDAGSFVNLNKAAMANLTTATPDTDLLRLPLSQEQVDAILDWVDQNAASTRTDGARDDYYNALSKPYNAKLRRFDSVDELLSVRYFTAADLYETSQTGTSGVTLPTLEDGREATLSDLLTTDSYVNQLRPDGQSLVNVRTNPNGLQAANVSPQTTTLIQQAVGRNANITLGEVLALVTNDADRTAILDNVTTEQGTRVEGKINLNTASEAVLMTLPNMTQELAQGIVAYQSTGFTKLSDILQVSGFSNANNLRSFAGYFTVRSSVFLVRVVGESNGSTVAIEAVVDTSSGTPRITKMHDLPFSDMPTRWGWSAEPTSDTVLVEAQ